MRISIVVCVYDRADELRRCASSLLASEHDDYEIVVVDDGSTDASADVARELATASDGVLRLVQNPRNLGVSGARNAGIRAARGDLILFVDSDCVVEPGWVAAYDDFFANHPGIGAASGRVVEPPPSTVAERAYRGSGTIQGSRLQRRRLMGCNMAFRRDWLVENVFDEALDYGSDEDEIAWRLERDGLGVGFVPEASVEHHHRVDLRGYLREAFRLGRGAARFGYKAGHGLNHDLWPITAALCLLPAMLLDLRSGFLVGLCLLAQVGAIAVNESFLKGKDAKTTLALLPLGCVYYGVKAWGAWSTWVRILAGGESRIRASRAADRARRREPLRPSDRGAAPLRGRP